LVHCLALIFPRFKFVWLAEETEKNLPIELDFINEGKNIERVAKLLEKFKFVKVIISQRTTYHIII
jgi:aarF domain-containing kinase